MEKLTRAVLSSDDGGVPLPRFASNYQRMTKTPFPWREYGFSSARDMLLSMETVVEFKFSDEENQFYLLPVHVTNTSNDSSHNQNTRIMAATSGRISSGIQHGSDNSIHSTASTNNTVVEMGQEKVFAMDHLGQVSVYLSQTQEKAARNFWNVCILSGFISHKFTVCV